MASPPMMKPRPSDAPQRPASPKAAIVPANGASGVQAAKRPPLSKRLPDMSDADLVSLQKSATRISGDDEHPKQAAAKRALTLIDGEIGRRASPEEPASSAAGSMPAVGVDQD